MSLVTFPVTDGETQSFPIVSSVSSVHQPLGGCHASLHHSLDSCKARCEIKRPQGLTSEQAHRFYRTPCNGIWLNRRSHLQGSLTELYLLFIDYFYYCNVGQFDIQFEKLSTGYCQAVPFRCFDQKFSSTK